MEDGLLNNSRAVAIAAVAAALLAAAACSSSGSGQPSGGSAARSTAGSSAAAYPVTLHAANGGVTISRRPAAIVSLSPTATEMLFAIGAGDQVKAVDKNSDYPAQAPHTDLDAYQLNVESLAAYRPDLVLASNLTPAQIKQLGTLGIPTLLEPAAANLSQAYEEITQIGEATGHQAGATELISTMRRQIASIVRMTPKQAGGGTYYYELDQTLYSVTSSTFIGKVLKLLGLNSIADSAKGAAASGGYPQLNAEFILRANPDYVFLADTKCCRQSARAVAKRPGWQALGAVQHGRVIELDDDVASRWGPRIVGLLRTVAEAVRRHPVPGSS
jgi:iron complex transport system substrate-binding protein